MPVQEDLPFAVASIISPSGMTLAGKHGTGVLSIGSMSDEGLTALPTQWSFAEESAALHGNTVDRRDWRIVMSWHIAETRDKARAQAKEGLFHWHNEYSVGTLMRPGVDPFTDPDDAVDKTSGEGSASVIGTPDDLVEAIDRMVKLTGGFGTVIGFVHDWANREDTLRSWDLVARYVIPEVNGLLDAYRESRQHVVEHRDSFKRANQAVLSKIKENPSAAAALEKTTNGRFAIPAHHAPSMEESSS